ncbi:MAG: hypothetical protein ACREAA_09760 [Candidatus Polarisedimenticolia bacterium]
MRQQSRFRFLLGLSLVSLIPAAVAAAPPSTSVLQTFSSAAVIDPPFGAAFLQMNIPTCGSGQVWLLKHVQVSPGIENGSTAQDLPQLPPWGASFHVFQNAAQAGAARPVTLIGGGPTHLSTSIEGGQHFGGYVEIKLLGQATATARFEFNVHVTGQCGTPSIMEF